MVLVVPDVWNYVHTKEELRERTVSNLNLVRMANLNLIEKYPRKEVLEGIYKAIDFLGWVIQGEYSKKIVNLARKQLERFTESTELYKLCGVEDINLLHIR